MGRVIADFGLSPEDMPKVDEEFISEIIGRKLLYNNRYGENREKVWNDILDFYVKQGKPAEVKDLNGFYVDRYSEVRFFKNWLKFRIWIDRQIIFENFKLKVNSKIFAQFKSLLKLLSDITFNVPILREITSRVERKTPVWTYRMDHYDKNIWKKHIPEQARGKI